MGKFVKGHTKSPNSGRKKGVQNKLTRTVKETVLVVFNALQDDPKHSLTAFAKKFPREFYAIAAKLIPTEISTNGAIKIKVGYGTPADEPD